MANYFKLVWKPEAYTRATGNPAPVGVKTTKGYIPMSDGEWVETDVIPSDKEIREQVSKELGLVNQEQIKVIKSLRSENASLRNECDRLTKHKNSSSRDEYSYDYYQSEPPRNVVDRQGRHVSSRRQAMSKSKLTITF